MRKEIKIEGLDSINAINDSGEGTVFRGKRVRDVDTFIKVLPFTVDTEKKEEQSTIVYLRELKKLRHLNQAPNIHVVKVINTGLTNENYPFIESEWINGPDLDELLTFPHNPIFKVEEVNKLLTQMADALAHCHSAQVKHGRINSHNIRLNNETGQFVLLNFGRMLLSDEQRKAGLTNVRAPEYLAPEQLNGEMLFESDIYSVGVLLFHLLTGNFPERKTSQDAEVPLTSIGQQIKEKRTENLPINWTDAEKAQEMNIPVWLLNTVAICLQDDPAKRYSNGIKLQDAVKLHSNKVKDQTLTDSSVKPNKEAEPKETKAAVIPVPPPVKEPEVKDIKAPVPQAPPPVKGPEIKDSKPAVVPVVNADEKDAEIKRLKSLIIQKDGQLDVYKYQTADYNPDLKKFTVSKPMLFAAIALFALLAALAAYAFFFRKAETKGLVTTYSDADTSSSGGYDAGYNAGAYSDSLSDIDTAALIASLPPIPEEEKEAARESIKAEEKKAKPKAPVRKPAAKKQTTRTAGSSPAKKVRSEPAPVITSRPIKSEPEQPREYIESKPKAFKNAKYTLAVSKAYLYDEPDVRSRRPVYLSNTNDSEFIASKDSNGFIYVVFFNTDRQITKGWLRKVDLRQVN